MWSKRKINITVKLSSKNITLSETILNLTILLFLNTDYEQNAKLELWKCKLVNSLFKDIILFTH